MRKFKTNKLNFPRFPASRPPGLPDPGIKNCKLKTFLAVKINTLRYQDPRFLSEDL